MKFDMCIKNIKNIAIQQLYVQLVMLISLVGVVILDYNKVCSQTLS